MNRNDHDVLMPHIMAIKEVIQETPDVKTFIIDNGEHKIQHQPGQFALLTPEFGHGEIVISISSSPAQHDTLAFSIKKAGRVTEIMHRLEAGDEIGVRGSYGNSFPMEALHGKNLVFIAGGIGLAPLRSVINTVFANRSDYNKVFILYGARSPQDLVFKDELFEDWNKNKDTVVAYSVDVGDDAWTGTVGFVPMLMDAVDLPIDNTKVLTCGPPIMIKFILDKLLKSGYSSADIITTLEMKMKCGIGKCGRCNIGSKYICIDGPVFTLAELENLPKEY